MRRMLWLVGIGVCLGVVVSVVDRVTGPERIAPAGREERVGGYFLVPSAVTAEAAAGAGLAVDLLGPADELLATVDRLVARGGAVATAGTGNR